VSEPAASIQRRYSAVSPQHRDSREREHQDTPVAAADLDGGLCAVHRREQLALPPCHHETSSEVLLLLQPTCCRS
jgi:hypothetical protein